MDVVHSTIQAYKTRNYVTLMLLVPNWKVITKAVQTIANHLWIRLYLWYVQTSVILSKILKYILHACCYLWNLLESHFTICKLIGGQDRLRSNEYARHRNWISSTRDQHICHMNICTFAFGAANEHSMDCQKTFSTPLFTNL